MHSVKRCFPFTAGGPTAYPVLAISPTLINTSADPLLIPYPVGIQANDVAIIQATLYDAVANNAVTAPSGWDVMANAFMNGVNGVVHCVFLKRLAGTESGNVTLDATGPYTGGNDTFEGHMSIWRGCKESGAPYEGLILQTAQSANMQGGAVTTLGDYRLLCHFGGTTGNGNKDATPAAGYTEQWEIDTFTGFGDGTMFLHTKEILTPTANPAATHTLSGSARWHECAFALIPLNG